MITITTRATTVTSITLVYMATIITMKRIAVTMLPTENSDVDGNAKDPYVNDIDHHDDNLKTMLLPYLDEKIRIQYMTQRCEIFNALFDCNVFILASHTVTDFQVVQKIGRNTTIHVITGLIKLTQISMMLRTNARKCQQISPLLNRNR